MPGVHPSRRFVVARHAAVVVVASVLAASACAAASFPQAPSVPSVPSVPTDPAPPGGMSAASMPADAASPDSPSPDVAKRDPAQLPPAPLPLRAAIDAAWRAHPGQRTVEARRAASRARLRAAGRPLHNPELELGRDDDGAETTTTVGLRMALDIADKRGARRDIAAARADLADADARLRRREFVRGWLAGWADTRAARDRVAAGAHRLALTARFAGLAERQFAAGDISGLERDLALLARDEASAEQSRLLAEQAEAEARFRSVGGSPEVDIDVPADGLPPPVAFDGDLRALPDWQIAQAAATVAEREVVGARRDRIADPVLGAYGGRKRDDTGGPDDTVFGVTVTVPLFVRNAYRAEVVAAEAEADAARAEREGVRLALEADHRRAVDSYAAARSAWQGWRASRGTDVARRTALLERLWREGELSTADTLLQLKQTTDTRLAGAELQARLWRTWTDYLAATGRLDAWAGLEAMP